MSTNTSSHSCWAPLFQRTQTSSKVFNIEDRRFAYADLRALDGGEGSVWLTSHRLDAFTARSSRDRTFRNPTRSKTSLPNMMHRRETLPSMSRFADRNRGDYRQVPQRLDLRYECVPGRVDPPASSTQ